MDKLSASVDSPETLTTRERILDAAAELYRQKGCSGTSIRNISGRVGINSATVYSHFGSKADLTLEILRRGLDQALCGLSAADDVLATGPPRLVLEKAIHGYLDVVLHGRPFMAALVRITHELPLEVRLRGKTQILAISEKLIEVLREASGDALPSQRDYEIQSLLLFGSMNSLLDWYHPPRSDKVSLKSIAERISRSLLYGLQPSASKEAIELEELRRENLALRNEIAKGALDKLLNPLVEQMKQGSV